MRIGYLHLGEAGHGLSRYGRMLASEARKHAELEVVEAQVVLQDDPATDGDSLRRAGEELAGTDLVHLQHNSTLWGSGFAQERNLATLLGRVRAPVVVTLHDVYLDDPWRAFGRHRSLRGRVRRFLRQKWPTRRALRRLVARECQLLVCLPEEASRLEAAIPGAPVAVIDHFVEEREALPDPESARRALGLEGSRIVTLLGFIHRSKGADLLLRALRELPGDVVLVLAGAPGPGNRPFVDKLLRRAERAEVADRLRITGFLSEEEQALYLSATDVPVAPFRFFSASGSLSTWISAGRRVLCHDLPQIRHYLDIAPGSLDVFAPYEPEALAAAIRHRLEADPADGAAVEALRRRLLLPAVFEQHLELYRAQISGTRTP